MKRPRRGSRLEFGGEGRNKTQRLLLPWSVARLGNSDWDWLNLWTTSFSRAGLTVGCYSTLRRLESPADPADLLPGETDAENRAIGNFFIDNVEFRRLRAPSELCKSDHVVPPSRPPRHPQDKRQLFAFKSIHLSIVFEEHFLSFFLAFF